MRRLVEVVWDDAHAVTSGWTDIDDLERPGFRVRSVGWELEGGSGHVVLAQSLSADGQVDHVLAIPKGMVLKITELAEKNP